MALMLAFLDSGRSNHRKLTKMTGSFRPRLCENLTLRLCEEAEPTKQSSKFNDLWIAALRSQRQIWSFHTASAKSGFWTTCKINSKYVLLVPLTFSLIYTTDQSLDQNVELITREGYLGQSACPNTIMTRKPLRTSISLRMSS